ncbi:hypothetical protein HK096_010062 [Nowakowskiella sp. JEL0078]|nr:hypothetical protein HK096_010062 [Nowakowskiella sp. JEL0078]
MSTAQNIVCVQPDGGTPCMILLKVVDVEHLREKIRQVLSVSDPFDISYFDKKKNCFMFLVDDFILRQLIAQEVNLNVNFKKSNPKTHTATSSIPTSNVTTISLPSKYLEDELFDLMLSYSWSQQTLVKKICENLRSRNFKVWMDVDQMKGNIYEKMATAISKSNVIVPCLSQEYSKSDNCIMELQHSKDERKSIVPVRLQNLSSEENAIAKLITSGKMYIDLSEFQTDDQILLNEELFDEKMKMLEGEIRAHLNPRSKSPSRTNDNMIDTKLRNWLRPVNFTMDVKRYKDDYVPGTRKWLVKAITEWLRKSEGCVMWLSGTAGVGKSIMAWLISENIPLPAILGSVFFCKHNDNDKNTATGIIKSIAFDLASKIPAFAAILHQTLQDDLKRKDIGKKSILEESVYDLFKTLVENGLNAITHPNTIVIIIDALDECGKFGDIERKGLLSFLSNLNLPSYVKLIVTGRPEIDIWNCLKDLNTLVIEPTNEMNETDLCIYISHRLTSVIESFTNQEEKTAIISKLADKSEGVFIYARFACDKIIQLNSTSHLSSIKIPNAVDQFQSGMDFQYSEILKEATANSDIGLIKVVLGTICILREPLSSRSIAALLGKGEGEIGAVIISIRKILNIDSQGLITVIHKSLKDCLTKRNPASDEIFIDIVTFDILLARQCLCTLVNLLKLDLCQLRDAGKFISEIENYQSLVSDVELELLYSIKYWWQHMTAIPSETGIKLRESNDKIFELIQSFAELKLLNWVEACSLYWKLDHAKQAAESAAQWINASTTTPIVVTKSSNLLQECSRLISRFRIPIELNPLQVYVTALPFCPLESDIKLTYPVESVELSLLNKIPKVTAGLDPDWGACLHVFEGHTSGVNSVVFSPDGSTIASASYDKTVRMWNPVTGTSRVFEGHKYSVFSVAFSPNGEVIASASCDNTVRVWNAVTGNSRVFVGHTSYVNSVAFSPDGETIVSASDDNTVRMWNVATGKSRVFKGHKYDVFSVAFSPHGTTFASGSKDKTVRVWSVATGTSRIFEGHASGVLSVVFSPNAANIASASEDNTVRVWNAITGTSRIFRGHTNWVKSVAFSPDGASIASGSCDNTVRVWNAVTGTSRVFEGHTSYVKGVVFSPDGATIASASWDNTVRIWNATTGTSRIFEGHKREVLRVAFSPDGKTIATADDNTVRIWNVTTGMSHITDDGIFAFSVKDGEFLTIKDGWVIHNSKNSMNSSRRLFWLWSEARGKLDSDSSGECIAMGSGSGRVTIVHI